MLRFILKIKTCASLIILTTLCMSTMGAVVSDNDGSAFITKAEFDSLKNDFQSRIDSYNNSIDAKIDNAISQYLAGIKAGGVKYDIRVSDWIYSIRFRNYPNFPMYINGGNLNSFIVSGAKSLNYDSWIITNSDMLKWSGSLRQPNFGSFINGNWLSAGSITIYPKVAAQDDADEFWYAQPRETFYTPYGSLNLNSKELEFVQLWALCSDVGRTKNVVTDLTYAMGINTCISTAYGGNNIAPPQPNWNIANNSQANPRISLVRFMSQDGYMFKLYVSKYNVTSTADGTFDFSTDEYQYLSSAYALVRTTYGSFATVRESCSIFGPRQAARMPKITSVVYCDIGGNESVACVEPWGKTSFYPDNQDHYREVHWNTSNRWMVSLHNEVTLYTYAFGAAWSASNAAVTFYGLSTGNQSIAIAKPKSMIYLNSLTNYTAAINGASVGFADGLPIYKANIGNGTVHLKISANCREWQYGNSEGVDTTSYSVFLHLNNSVFPVSPYYGSNLHLCDSNGSIMTSLAHSISATGENPYKWDVYVPIKKGETLYAKLETNDRYATTMTYFTKIEAVFETEKS